MLQSHTKCSSLRPPDALSPAGVVVGASRAGEGMIGCGGWRAGGVEAYEALRWSLARINQNVGGIGSRIVSDSYVPGVKFGGWRGLFLLVFRRPLVS